MEGLLKSDIFFFLTGLAVILVTALVVIALIYVIKILRDLRDISHTVKEESEEIKSDIDSLRANVKKGGNKIKKIISNAASPRRRKRKQ